MITPYCFITQSVTRAHNMHSCKQSVLVATTPEFPRESLTRASTVVNPLHRSFYSSFPQTLVDTKINPSMKPICAKRYNSCDLCVPKSLIKPAIYALKYFQRCLVIFFHRTKNTSYWHISKENEKEKALDAETIFLAILFAAIMVMSVGMSDELVFRPFPLK